MRALGWGWGRGLRRRRRAGARAGPAADRAGPSRTGFTGRPSITAPGKCGCKALLSFPDGPRPCLLQPRPVPFCAPAGSACGFTSSPALVLTHTRTHAHTHTRTVCVCVCARARAVLISALLMGVKRWRAGFSLFLQIFVILFMSLSHALVS